MPAVSPLAATAAAPTPVGGAVSAESGAFAQALARVEDSAKPVTKSATRTHGAPAREVETETASTEATPPASVAGADRPVASSEAEAAATDENSITASADEQGEAESEALSLDALAQDVTAQGVTAQGVTAQDATAEGVSAKGITAERVTAQDATVQGATAEGFAAQGAPALVGIPQTPQTVAFMSVAGTAETAAGSQDLAVPGLNAEQTASTEVVPASGTADAGEAVQTAVASAPPPAVAVATTAASSSGLPLSGLPVRDPAAGPAPTSRRADGRTVEADAKAASAPRADLLDALGVQARTTASVAATADGSAATLLSAQMAGQAPSDGQPELTELALDAAGDVPDEAAPLTVAPAPTTASSATAGAAAAVHGSQLAASTIETTAQLAAQIARRLEGRSTRFDMALTPDDLGRVDVSLDIDADGGLTARLAFDNPLAATELRGRADELRRQLQDAGFTVGADSLSFSEREAGSSNGGSDQGFGRGAERAFVGAGRLTDDLDTVAVPPAWISHSQTPQGVDLKV